MGGTDVAASLQVHRADRGPAASGHTASVTFSCTRETISIGAADAGVRAGKAHT